MTNQTYNSILDTYAPPVKANKQNYKLSRGKRQTDFTDRTSAESCLRGNS